MPEVFISYTREDQAVARHFADGFDREGLSVWWDQTLRSGDVYDRVTEKALEEAKAVVVLWSARSVESRWVRAEATQADRNGSLIPALIEPCKRPIMFELTHTADLSGWKGDASDRRWQAFVADVRAFISKGSTLPSGTARTAPAIAAAPVRFPPRWMIPLLIASLVVGAAGFWVIGRKASTDTRTPSIAAQRNTNSTPVSLAVLPFADMSPAGDQESFSDGLTEEILNELAQIKALRLIARTSSFAFKGRNEDIRVIGKTLGVDKLLEGSIRKDGIHLRITAQLIQAADGSHVWSKTYDRELSGVFALQEEIAKDVAAALSIALGVGEMTRAKGGTTNVEAYEKYARASGALQKADLLQSAQLLREATELDPQFSLAWLNLYRLLPPLASGSANHEALLRERDEIARKLETLPLDDSNRNVFEMTKSWLSRRWETAVPAAESLARSTTVSVDDAIPSGLILLSVGRSAEAVLQLQRAVQIDPLGVAPPNFLMIALDAADRRDEIESQLDRLPHPSGDQERLKEWTRQLRRWLGGAGDPAALRSAYSAVAGQIVLTDLYAALVQRPNDSGWAIGEIRKAFDSPGNQSEGALTNIAQLAAHYGDKPLALAALNRSLVERRYNFVPSLWDSTLTSLRNEAGFKQILAEVGLVDYWRASGNWGDFCRAKGEMDIECH